MKAEIVSVGTELLLGEVSDTNAAYLAAEILGLKYDDIRRAYQKYRQELQQGL